MHDQITVLKIDIDISGPSGESNLETDEELNEEVCLRTHLACLDGLWLQLAIVLMHLGLMARVDDYPIDPVSCSQAGAPHQ